MKEEEKKKKKKKKGASDGRHFNERDSSPPRKVKVCTHRHKWEREYKEEEVD